MPALLRLAYRISDWLKENLLIVWLWLPLGRKSNTRETVPVIASLTTYPPRIGKAWMAIETLLRQSVTPLHLVLVLNLEEFPAKKLPRRIRQQTARGLEIVWAARNGRSHDKLIPVRSTFPGHTIVTFDDDKFFPLGLLEKLVAVSTENPGALVGARGWVIRRASGQKSVHFGKGWTRAEPNETGHHLLTPGGNGCLYPYDSLHPLVDDLDEALTHCPTADDIWFWAAAQKNKSKLVCLGLPAHRPVSALKEGPALSNVNSRENESQFQKALDYFGIRSRLLRVAQPEVGPNG